MTATPPRWPGLLGAGLLGLSLIGPCFYLPRQTEYPFAISTEFWIVVVAWTLAAVVAGTQVWRGRAPLGGGDAWVRRLGAAFLGWALLTACIGSKPALHLTYVSAIAAYMIGAQAVVGWLEGGHGRARFVIRALAGLLAVQIVIGLLQYFQAPFLANERDGVSLLDGWLRAVGSGVRDKTAIGTLGNINYLTELFVLVIPIVAGAALTTRRRFDRVAGLALVLAGLGIVGLNGSRAGMLGLIVGAGVAGLVCLWGSPRVRDLGPAVLRHKTVAGVAAAVGLAFVAVAGHRFYSSLVVHADDYSNSTRWIQYKAAASLWLEHPITGTGIGGYALRNVNKLFELYPEGVPAAGSDLRFVQLHSDPFQALVETGVVGFTLLAALAFLWLRRMRAAEALPLPLRFGLVMGVVALGTASCFGFPFHTPLTAWAVLVALAVSVARLPEVADQDAPAPLGAARPVLAAGCVVLIAVVGWQATYRGIYQTVLGNHYEYLGGNSGQRDKKSPTAAVMYALALRHDVYKPANVHKLMVALGTRRRFEEALAVYDAHVTDGLGADAMTIRAGILRGLKRKEEAIAAYKKVYLFYCSSHRNGRLARRRLHQYGIDLPEREVGATSASGTASDAGDASAPVVQ